MRFRFSFCSLVLGLIMAGLPVDSAFGQALTEFRDWTNEDGKTIRAELLFGPEVEEGVVRLRVKNGVVHKVNEAVLSREDRALILKHFLERSFRASYNDRLGAHFFYSKKIARNDESLKTVAYIGNDKEGAWIRMKANVNSGVANGGVALLIVGDGAPPIRLDYEEGDLEFERGNAQIDVSLTKHAGELKTLLQTPEKLKLAIQRADGVYNEIKLSEAEIDGLQEVSRTYQTLLALTTDFTWWATFKGLDRDALEQEKAAAEAAKLAESEAAMKAAEMPEEVKQVPLTEVVAWEIADVEAPVEGAVVGFDRKRVLINMEGVDEPEAFDGSAFSVSQREVLAALRQTRFFEKNWHPIDEEQIYFWPKALAPKRERLNSNGLVFVTDRETGAAGIVLQQQFEIPPSNRPKAVTLRGKVVGLDLPFEIGAADKLLRDETTTTAWLPLSEEYIEVLLVASPALEGLRFEYEGPDGETKSGEFSEAEFAASIEAIEVYRLWHSLAKPEDSL